MKKASNKTVVVHLRLPKTVVVRAGKLARLLYRTRASVMAQAIISAVMPSDEKAPS